MATSRNDKWSSGGEVYSPVEVEAVLRSLGIDIVEETDVEFMSLCPYHGNTNSPAFGTSKLNGFSVCFNPSCAKGFDRPLSLQTLVKELKGVNHFVAKRFIASAIARAGVSFQEKFDSIKEPEKEMVAFPDDVITIMHKRFMDTPAAQEYMVGRGFEMVTLQHFNVGFALAATGFNVPVYREHDMVMVPAYDVKNRPVGLVGRSLVGKEFKNYGAAEKGKGFRKSHIIWNLQNARKYETVIICESTFDAMRIHQAGYPNVVALLGGSLSQIQKEMLNRHFSKVIIMTDNENDVNKSVTYHRNCSKCAKLKFSMCQGHRPGRDLGMKIAESLPRMKIMWATYDDKHIYARDVKDATDMSDDEIRQTLRNAISHFEYLEWVA